MGSKADKRGGRGASVWKGAIAGAVGGLAASYAMDRFQEAWIALASRGETKQGAPGSSEEPATEKAASAVSEGLFGHKLTRAEKKIGGTAVNKIEHWAFADSDPDDAQVAQVNTDPPSVYGFGHEPYYRNVLRVLRGEAVADTDGRGGRKSLELILGIYESAKTGREVPLPLRATL